MHSQQLSEPQGVVARSDAIRRSAVYMDTTVTIEIRRDGAEAQCLEAIERAFGWFDAVERECSRFDPESGLRRLTSIVGTPIAVSPMLFAALDFALQLARETDGAFDPTIGGALERVGFNQNFRTGIETPSMTREGATYRNVHLDQATHTVTIDRPLTLDLGAVAKGMAIDLAGQELASWPRFCVFAGGDLRVGNASGEPFRIGIQHPRVSDCIVAQLVIDDGAVCTSGDYQRVNEAGTHHILDARSALPSTGLTSVTVIAPTAMLADGLSTAAFVLGAEDGLALLEANRAEGFLVSSDGVPTSTRPFASYCA